MRVTKLMQLAFLMGTAVFATVSAHAQYSCTSSNLKGQYVIGGEGKKIGLSVGGLVNLEQEHVTVGYVVLDGNGNITDGKTEEELDDTITERTGLTGSYVFNGSNGCEGTLTIQGAGYNRTFNLSVNSFDSASFSFGIPTSSSIGLAFDLLPNGNNGEDEVYSATLSGGASTTFSPNLSSLTPTVNATTGCTADMLWGHRFAGSEWGGDGGTFTRGEFNVTFSNSGTGTTEVQYFENSILNGTLQPSTTTTYTAVVNPDCSVEIDSGNTKVGEFMVVKKAPITDQAPAAGGLWGEFHGGRLDKANVLF